MCPNDRGAAVEGFRTRERDTLAARMSGDGFWFDSGAWTVTARREVTAHR